MLFHLFFNPFGTTEIDDEAPPYAIVQACRRLGFYAPEDVRWCQVSAAPPASKPQPESGRFRILRSFFGKRGPKRPRCACGRPLPRLENHTFTLRSGEQNQLRLGQCHRCKTIYWQEP